MTSFHTPIATGAAANASVFNAPLAALDAQLVTITPTTAEVIAARAAYPNLGARLDDLLLSGGNIATNANGVSAAGQKVLTVDATTGFIVGAYVTYLLDGTTLEGNTIASIQAGVSLTLGTNIGTGGVLDDTYISMISISEYLAAQAIPHAGTLMLPQTMEYINGKEYHVEAYGGSPAASAATNRAAFVAAIAAAIAAGGGTVSIGAGTFAGPGTTIALAGANNLTIKGSGWDTVIDQSGNNARVFDLSDTANVTIRDIQFLGDFASDDMASQGAIVTDCAGTDVCTGLRVLNCRFETLAGDGMRIGPNTSDVIIAGNTFNGGLGFVEMVGVDDGSTDVRPVTNVVIVNNVIIGTPIAGGRGLGSDDFIDAAGAVLNITISGNVFDGAATPVANAFGASGILLMTIIGYGQARNWSITNNTFRRITSDGSVVTTQAAISLSAIAVTTDIENITISGNSFDGCRYGVHVQSLTTGGVNVSANSFYNCLINVFVNAADNVAVTSNRLTAGAVTSKSVHLQGDNLICSDNRIVAATTGSKWGLFVTSGDDNLISNNVITGGVSAGTSIYLASTTRAIVANNIITDQPGTGIVLDTTVNTRLRANSFDNNGANINNTTGTGTVIAGMTCVGTWQQDNVAANQSAVALALVGAGRTEAIMAQAGSIVGMASYSNEARTAGYIYIEVTVNGTGIGLVNVIGASAVQTHVAIQPQTTDVFAAGDRIGVKLTTEGEWLPVSADVTVTVAVVFD